MVSTYGYTTLASLEAHAKRDYSLTDSTQYSDANVESSITDAEIWINGFVNTIFTGTIPADITFLTNVIAKMFLGRTIKERTEGPLEDLAIINKLKELGMFPVLERYRAQYEDKPTIWYE